MSAVISEDGLYRYALGRRWDTGPRATFIMLNPSTADAELDDPTIRRCIGFAKSWNCGSLSVVNLYAYRATDPKALWKVADPVGPENNDWLARMASEAHDREWPLVGAWGANAKPDRVRQVLNLLGPARLTALGVTKAGAPKHPLYLPAISPRLAWP